MSAAASSCRPNRATPARQLALEVTTLIRERSAFANELIQSKVRQARVAPEERDFAILLIRGVVATSGELDYLLDCALHQGTIKPDVRDALRISAYELFFLKKAAHIAVDQGVELVRSFAPQATGFANKVLHETAKLRDGFPFGNPTTDPQALAHQHAFPLWLTQRLISDLGYEMAALFMEASNQQAPLFLVDLKLGTSLEITPTELKDYLPRIEAGEMIVVDDSAQKVAVLATPATDRPFLEVGSGRGTKTILLAHNARRTHGAQPQLFALDLHAFKHGVLSRRVEAYGLDRITPVVGDATRLDTLIADGRLPESFAGVLVDAPCSGTGTLRRHPEIRWRLTPEAVTSLATQARAMLVSVAPYTDEGGFIVYSTCSVLAEENEQVIEDFLASNAGKGFALDGELLRSSLAPGSPDAHFAARLVKKL